MSRPRRRAARPGALLSLLLLAGTAGAQSRFPEKGFHVTDNVVESIRVVGDSVYVGGRFTHVGPYTGPLAAVSLTTGETLADFPEANDRVFAVAADGAGGWFVGGDFTEIGGVARNHVAHVLPDLTVNPAWDADADNRVRGFALHGDRVYLYGHFARVGGEFRSQLAAVNRSTGALDPWDPDPDGGGVDDIQVDDGILYVTGNFTTIAGQARDIAAFDLSTGDLTPFDPPLLGDVLCLAVRDGVLYAGGRFSASGDSTRNKLAAFDTATSALLPWRPDVPGTPNRIEDIELADSTAIVAGAFSTVNGAIHRAIAEVDLDQGAALNDFEGTTGLVNDVLIHDGRLLVAGDFLALDGVESRFLGGYDRVTSDVLDLPAPLDIVNTIAASGDTLVVGGDFGAVNGLPRRRFAAFHASTLELLPFAPEFEDIVWSMEANATGDTLWVGGRFEDVGGVSRPKAAAFDLATGTLTSFNPDFSGDVYDLAVSDSLVYLGGTYSVVNGQLRSDLCAVDRATGGLADWDPSCSGFVNTIAAKNDTIFVGGSFSAIGDSSRLNLAAIDGISGEALDWGTDISLIGTNEIESFFPLDHPAYPQGGLFIGGDFLNLGIGLRRGLAAVHRDTGNTLYSFNARLESGFETEVRDYALVEGKLYIAGDFGGIFTADNRGAGAVDVVTGEASNWVVDAGKANTIAAADSMIFVGGNTNKVQGYWHTNLAAFRLDREPPLPAAGLVAAPGALDRRIDLTWSPSTSDDVDDYLVYRTATSGADTTGNQVAVVDGTAHTDTAPAYGEWFYRVYARDEAGNLSPASNESSALAPDRLAPVAPSGLIASAGDGEVTLIWSGGPEGDLAAYRIYADDVSPPVTLADSTVAGDTTSVVTGLANGTTYFFAVTAVDSAGNESEAPSPIPATPNDGTSAPVVVTSVLQNPLLSQYADVTVVADTPLTGVPAVTLQVAPDPAAAVTMEAVPGGDATYRGPVRFDTGGVHTLRTTAGTATGTFEFERSFTVTPAEAARETRAWSVDGSVALRIPAGALRADAFLRIDVEGPQSGAGPIIHVGPSVALDRTATLELPYDPDRMPPPDRLIVLRREADRLVEVIAEVLPDRGIVRARIDRLGTYEIGDGTPASVSRPVAFAVHPPRPNPFRDATTIGLELPRRSVVRVEVFDVNGRRIAALHHGPLDAGVHSIPWTGRDHAGRRVAAGIYFGRIRTDQELQTIKIVRLR